MKRLVEFPLDTGEPILVEVEDVGPSSESWRGLSPSAVVERAQTSFENALEKARIMPADLSCQSSRNFRRTPLKTRPQNLIERYPSIHRKFIGDC
jgi:hypothetical protein